MLNNIVGLLNDGVTTPPNSYESISTVTVGSGGSSTITFSSIPSTYKHLQIRSMSKSTNNAVQWATLNFNDSTGKWSYHTLYGDGSGATSTGGGGTDNVNLCGLVGSQFGGMVIDILDYANTNKNKVIRSAFGYDANGSGYVGMNSGNWNVTSAVTKITIEVQATTYPQYSSFALYGIKG